MRLTLVAGLLLLTASLAAPAAAQNYDASANYGDLHLQPGFTPDPALVSLLAGGGLDASARFQSCRGYITETPDLRLFWDGTRKGGPTLKISAISNADTTLVINGPDGQWYCDDDAGEDSNPMLELTPQVGRYEIWVGVYSQGDSRRAVLSISEVGGF